MKNRTDNTRKNITLNLIQKIVMIGLQFATKTIFIRLLGSEYLGINSLVTSVLSFLNVADLGLGSSIVFALYKPIADGDDEKVRSYLRYYGRIYRGLGYAIAAIGIAMVPFLNILIDVEVEANIYIIYFLNLINSFSSFVVFPERGSYIEAKQEHYRITGINTVLSAASVIVQIIVLSAFSKPVNFYLYSTTPIVISIVKYLVEGVLVGHWYPASVKGSYTQLLKSEKKALYKNAYGAAIERISAIANNSIDSIVISGLIGTVQLGYYTTYYSLIAYVTGFVDIVFTSMRPSIGNLNAEASTAHKKDVFNALRVMSCWIYGLCTVGFLVIVQPFVRIWVGEEFIMPISLVIAICLNFLTAGMNGTVSLFRSGCGLYFESRYRPVLMAFLNVVFSILFCRVWGTTGIVLATTASRMATMWWLDALIVFKNIFGESPKAYYLSYLKDIVLITTIAGLSYGLCELLPFTSWRQIIMNGSLAVLLFNLFFCVNYRKKKEFIYLRNTAKRILHIR